MLEGKCQYFSIFYDFNMSTKAKLTVNFPSVKFRKIWQTVNILYESELTFFHSGERQNKKKAVCLSIHIRQQSVISQLFQDFLVSMKTFRSYKSCQK